MPLQLTTKTDATRTINTAKTLAETSLTTSADVNALVKSLREQLPAKIIVIK